MLFASLIERLKGLAASDAAATYIRERRAERQAAAEAAKAQGADAQLAAVLAVDEHDAAHADEIAAAIVEAP